MLEEMRWERRYPRSVGLSIWSGAIAIVCVLMALLFLVPVYGSYVFLLFLVAALVLLAVTFSFRFVSFYRVHRILFEKGSAGRRITSTREEVARGFVIVIATVVAAGSPLLLMVILPPAEWFAVVTGAFFGVSCAEILFLVVIRSWERSAGVSVYRYRIYSAAQGRRVLVEYGLKVSGKRVKEWTDREA